MRRGILALAIVAAILVLLLPSMVSAGGIRPKLGFLPSFRFLPVGQTASLEVRASGMVSLYGGEFVVRYDPAALEILDADPNTEGIQISVGEVFGGADAFVVVNSVDAAQGSIHFAATLLEPAPPIQGTAILARFTVRAQRPGSTMLRFTSASLLDSQANLLDVLLQNAGLWLGPLR